MGEKKKQVKQKSRIEGGYEDESQLIEANDISGITEQASETHEQTTAAATKFGFKGGNNK